MNQENVAQNVELIKKFFINPSSRMAIGHTSLKGALSVEVSDIDTLLRGHLSGNRAPIADVRIMTEKNPEGKTHKGHFRAGAYTPGVDGFTKWLCIDFDGGTKHSNPLADAKTAALETLQRLHSAGIIAYLEKSGGGEGWHIWVFFSEPLSCGRARALGLKYAPVDAPLVTSGKYANPEKNIGIEVFPKQSVHKPGSFNNQVWLPFWSEAPVGANQFYCLNRISSSE